MVYSINEECTNCGVCEPECPVEAIKEEGDVRIIDADICTGCAVCVDTCPVGAILEG